MVSVLKGVLVVNNNFIFCNMGPTEYDADMHSGIKIRIFGTVASLEHNCHILGTQLPHLWNTTVASLERNVLAVWRGV